MSHSSFYKNVFWQYGLQILKYLFPFILIPYLTRVLDTGGYAVYAYVLSFMAVMQTIADFGFTLSGTKEIVAHKGDLPAQARLVSNITAAKMILIVGLLVVSICIAQFIPIMSENMLYVVLAFGAVALRALLPDFVFQGFEKMGPLTTRYFVSKGVQVVLVLLFVHSANDLPIVAIADILGCSIALIWSFVSIKRLFGISVTLPHIKQSVNELKTSAIYCVSNVSSSLFSGFTTVIIGLALTDRADIAYWSLTLTTVTAVQALYSPIMNSLYPHMLNGCDFKFARKLALLAAPALIVGTVAYCLLSQPIMLLLGGEGYLGGAHVMVMIAPVLAFSFYAMFLGWPLLGAMGYVKELTATTVISGAFNVVAMLALYLTGWATLDSICVVRWITDAVLFMTRAFVLWRVMRDTSGKTV